MADLVESAKKKAAYQAVEANVTKDTTVVGIGSGTTVVYVVERLASFIKENNMKPVRCVPTSYQAKELIVQNPQTLILSSLDVDPELQVAFDGADEMDSQFNCIKGGGGALTQEKIVASCAKRLVIVADYRKNSTFLGQQYKKGVPIEVLPMALVPVSRKLQAMYAKYKPVVRLAGSAKIGPIVTDNGNVIIDLDLQGNVIEDAVKLDEELRAIPGIIETGLFCGMASSVYFGNADGSVLAKTK